MDRTVAINKWPEIAIYVGRNAKLASVIAGLIIAGMGIAVAFYSVMQATVFDAQQKMDQQAKLISSVSIDSRNLLIRLNEKESTSCSQANLARLRGILHEYRYAREVGIFDTKGRVYCTTDIGRLPVPIAEPAGSYVLPTNNKIWPTRQLKLKGGPRYWPSLTLFDSPNKPIKAMILEYGRFNIVLDPFFRKEMFATLQGRLWAQIDKNHIVPMLGYESPKQIARLQPTLLATLKAGVEQRLFPPRIEIAKHVPGTNIFVYDSLNMTEILRHAPNVLFAGIAISLLLGTLVTMVLSPRFTKYQSLDYRIQYLCDQDHVICLYQPIVRMADGSIAGAEVLMRICDDGTVLRPDQVFPHIVANGMTWETDKAVTTKACEELSPLYHELNGMKIALNFFPEDLRFDTAGKHLKALCERYSLDPTDITVELTEHQLASNSSILGELSHFREEGFALSVDDFGTGYSNLGSIKKIMPDHLKIDRSFVFEMERKTMKSSLIPEIIAIARAVNAEVIAEGIEEYNQMVLLRDLYVEYGQGYYFAKPLPIDEFRQFVLQHSGNQGQGISLGPVHTK